MENNVLLLIVGIFIVLIINIFYLFHKIKNQTKKAKQEFEDYLEKKIQLFLAFIEEVKKYAKLSKVIESKVKETIENIKKAKGPKERKSLSNKISSVTDSIFESISHHSDLAKRIREDLKEIEVGMDSFKNLWLNTIMFFKKNKKKEKIVEEKRVKVKIKKKK